MDLFKNLTAGVSGGGHLEVSLIGGIQRTALRVIKAAHKVEAKINFAAANFSQQRSDAAAVDMKGNIYYGDTDIFRDVPSVSLHRTGFLRVEEQLYIEQFGMDQTIDDSWPIF